MGRSKLSKFADLETFPNVFQYPYHALAEGERRLRGRWGEDVFGNGNPIVLELGCGRGEYAVALGRENPACNYVGIDIKGARIWTGAAQALAEGLINVAFLRAEVESLDRLFAPGEADGLWLAFSDPQMKKAGKRMTSTFFLERYRHFLKDGGTVNVKTDSDFLYTYTRCVVEENRLPLLRYSADIYADDGLPHEVTGIRTYYESLWRARGLAIKFISFSLPHTGGLREPDREIPPDSYRSRGRLKDPQPKP